MFDAIINIHGFNGSTNSPRVQHLRAKFPKTKVFAPDYNDRDPHQGYNTLLQFVTRTMKKYPHLLLTGCSLGGFWSHVISNQLKLPSLLLNPAMEPWDTLKKYVDEKFTEEDVATYHDFRFKNALPRTVYEPRIVLLESGDKVIDPHNTQKMFRGHCDVRLLPGGSHRFDNLIAVDKAVTELGNTFIQHGPQ